MPGTNKPIDPLPEQFSSPEEAAVFWDTHSITDYEEFLEPVDIDADIKRRHFQIEVDEESFLALRETARRERKPVKQLASEILKRRLTAG
ncbi:MAG: hypothetical protein JW741_04225 [Sedimentisphaerales bacterium]|nr:hypothetical protein [Sedimentisphaerales bacterium]